MLDRKYKTKDVGAKNLSSIIMVDSKTVASQVQELQVILHKIHAEGMDLSETFQVATIIENALLLGKISRTTLSVRERK